MAYQCGDEDDRFGAPDRVGDEAPLTLPIGSAIARKPFQGLPRAKAPRPNVITMITAHGDDATRSQSISARYARKSINDWNDRQSPHPEPDWVGLALALPEVNADPVSRASTRRN
jgi:hypothetical protein